MLTKKYSVIRWNCLAYCYYIYSCFIALKVLKGIMSKNNLFVRVA